MSEVIPVTQKLDLLVQVEGLLFNGEEDSLKKALELIGEIKNRILVSNMILTIGDTKPLAFETFGKFCLKLKEMKYLCESEKFLKNPFFTYSCFGDYLIKIGVFNADQMNFSIHYQKSVEEFTKPFLHNKLGEAILNDDVYSVNEISKIKNLEQEAISFMDNEQISPMALAVFCGAENVANYLIKNFYEIDEDAIDYAVRGGNENIIEKLASMDVVFDNQLENAIQYHHNQLAHWLMKHYKSTEHVSIEWCADMFNTEMLVFFLSNGHTVDELGTHNMTALHRAALLNNLPLARFLIERGANKKILENHNLKAKDLAISEKMKELLNDEIVE